MLFLFFFLSRRHTQTHTCKNFRLSIDIQNSTPTPYTSTLIQFNSCFDTDSCEFKKAENIFGHSLCRSALCLCSVCSLWLQRTFLKKSRLTLLLEFRKWTVPTSKHTHTHANTHTHTHIHSHKMVKQTSQKYNKISVGLNTT